MVQPGRKGEKEWKYLLVRQPFYNTVRQSLKSLQNLVENIRESEKLLI